MKIKLNYNEFTLGFLAQNSQGYVWTPDVNEINKAKEKYEYGMDMFFLPSVQKVYTFIPRHFNEFLEASDRADLMEKAHIDDSDSDFVRLYKLSKLDFFNQEFVIKS